MRKLPYFKPFLTFEEQARLLEERGLLVTTYENRKFLADFLMNLNFHRFEGYCLRYYQSGSKTHVFKSGTSVTRIQNDYYADKIIRLETFSMLQDFEISLRSQIASVLGSRYGAFPYKAEYFHSTENEWNRMLEEHIRPAVRKANESYIKSFRKKYSEEIPPIWMVVELLSFGELSNLYKNLLKFEDRNKIAAYYSLPSTVMESWLHSLTVLRNKCAHHSKLIDTQNPFAVILPHKIDKRYNSTLKISGNQSFLTWMLMLCYLAEASGRKSFAVSYLLDIDKTVSNMQLECSQLGFPEGVTIQTIMKVLGFRSNKPQDHSFKTL